MSEIAAVFRLVLGDAEFSGGLPGAAEARRELAQMLEEK